ncbi:MAG: HD domain-containing protein [Deltaproteobacteria bacterium]|nr:HD domain-containing protein [Deltaproteobacteria bacterium]
MAKTRPNSVRILVVDDEPAILSLYQATLQPRSKPKHFELTLCRQAAEAFDAFQTAVGEGKPFAVAFLDLRMPPGPDGIWLAERIRSLDPYTEIVMVTGYSDTSTTPDKIASRVPPTDKLLYLQKPFHNLEIQHFAASLSTKWLGEIELRKIRNDLEGRIEQRTMELIKLNEQLKQDIARRENAEAEVQSTLDKLRSAMSGVVQAMALTVERRDPYTAGHQRRVSDLARGVAAEMTLPTHQIDGIRMAGLIHDLGKICVPVEILSKPGQLTEIEHTLIKDHPQVGYEILKEIEFPWPVAQIVLQHHERIDGSGYPVGLSGDDIIIEAKTLAVADVVEAMASHRPYRPTLGRDMALKEICQNRGVLYDADVVDACMKLLQEKNFQFRT